MLLVSPILGMTKRLLGIKVRQVNYEGEGCAMGYKHKIGDMGKMWSEWKWHSFSSKSLVIESLKAKRSIIKLDLNFYYSIY